MSEKVFIDQLKPGMVIVQILQQNGPVRIRKSGLVSSEAMVQGLKEMGVLELEVDPHQQVELDMAPASAPVSASPTQGLFTQQSSAAGVDKVLSDQFNRSLFLPSAQGITPQWRRVLPLVLKSASLAMTGLALGVVLARGPGWIQSYQASSDVALEPATESSAASSVDAQGEQAAAQPEPSVPSDVNEVVKQGSALNNEGSHTTENTTQEPVQNALQASEAQERSTDSDLTTAPADEFAPPPEGQDAFSRSQQNEQSGQISPELLKRFQDAVAEVKPATEQPVTSEPLAESESGDLPRIDQLPAWMLTELPSMSFSAHMYASDPSQRWVRVNNQEKVEGDLIGGKVQLLRIEPQKVILLYQGQEFSMNALTDW